MGDNLEIHHAVAAATAGEVLVAVVDGEPEHGWWGEVLTVAAMARGVAGLVIDACVRDSAAIAARRFPVWSAGLALPGARKVTRGQMGAPIVVRGTTVSPGDWVVADEDGIVVIDGDRLDAVRDAGRGQGGAGGPDVRGARAGPHHHRAARSRLNRGRWVGSGCLASPSPPSPGCERIRFGMGAGSDG